MSSLYVADRKAVVSIQGLRYIVKSDYRDYKGKESFALKVAYKGENREIVYKDQRERDVMYDRIVAALPKCSTI